MQDPITPEETIEFWYSDRVRLQWFASTPELDAEMRLKYEPLWCVAAKGELDGWKTSPLGCLALAIVLDQFPLNMFRGQAISYATEQQAVGVSRYAVSKGYDKALPKNQVAFLYMPLMHSENTDDQDLSVELFERAGLEENLRFARHHRELVRRFGRFPHRNAILGRTSTPQEIEYLNSKEAFLG